MATCRAITISICRPFPNSFFSLTLYSFPVDANTIFREVFLAISFPKMPSITFWANSIVISFFVKEAKANNLTNAPSIDLISSVIAVAINSVTSYGMSKLSFCALFIKIAIRVSKSGGCISTISPD